MMKSLYSGVSGLKTHNQRMDVIGNNIANVNTTGYKASKVAFKDVYYQTKTSASAGGVTQGGKNPIQVGYGSSVVTVNQVMTQSGLTYSDSVYDCALQGEGFFRVMDEAGNIYYSRSGVFNVDNAGNLVDGNGYIVLGTNGNPTNVEASSQRLNLNVPDVISNTASVTKIINGTELTVSASGAGPEGNISLAFVDGDVPFASLSGTTLTVTFDFDKNFATQQEFEDEINNAIALGGITIEGNALPLNFDFEYVPANVSSVAASNTLTFPDGTTDDLNLNFTSNLGGEFANAYTVALKTSSTATAVTAKWSNDVLTITVPGNNTITGNPASFTVEDIQNALNTAAGMSYDAATGTWSGGSDKLKLTVTATDRSGNDASTTVDGFDYETVIGANTVRTKLANGKDNFYGSIADAAGTIVLQDGRIDAEQTVANLESVYIGEDGTIWGVHAVHGTFPLGRIDIATFENPIGLEQVGTSYWKESLSSGEPKLTIPGENGAGSVVSGALEMSNVDLSQEFSDMIVTQRGFQANSRIITTSDTMLEELINLKR